VKRAVELSLAEARALALAAQGLAVPRRAATARRHVLGLVEDLGVVQIDSVNVLVRAHYLPAFARLGAYDVAHLDRLAHRAPRALFEYWGHEASLLPVALHPLLRWRMAQPHRWKMVRTFGQRRRALVATVLAQVAERGPLATGDLELPSARKKSGWWEWSDAKKAIEWLFWTGQVTIAARRGFERLYDLPERVLPPDVVGAPTPAPADARRQLVELAARALGVATDRDLRDYYRLPLVPTRAAVAELVEAGTLRPVTVEGWPRAYLHRDATARTIDPTRTALLSPFDSMIWSRERTARLFGMTYRIEIYTPAPRRVHGYYVLPFLLGDRLVARVDLKADRAAGALLVQAAHAEPGMPREAPAALARELEAMARWLGLERVVVARRGDLAARLRAAGPTGSRPGGP
jgi:uncharacterized protein YcaQ